MILTDNQSYEKLKLIKNRLRHCHEDLMTLDENLLEVFFICDNMIDFIFSQREAEHQTNKERCKDV